MPYVTITTTLSAPKVGQSFDAAIDNACGRVTLISPTLLKTETGALYSIATVTLQNGETVYGTITNNRQASAHRQAKEVQQPKP